MSASSLIHLRVLLPHGLFLEKGGVSSVVAETAAGYFGILPRRLDCAAALVPGILSYRLGEAEDGETYVAVDEGILLKTGRDVTVCVRNATDRGGLGELRQAVEELYGNLDENQRAVRSVLARLESHFVRQIMQFGNERPG